MEQYYGTGRRKEAVARVFLRPGNGKVTVNGCAIKLMDTKPSVRTPAPQLGQNNRDIFEGVLGMTEEQFNTLHEKQVF